MSGVGGTLSIIRDKYQNIVYRLYLTDDGSEYYEVVLTPDKAVETATETLCAAQMAKYFIKTLK